MGAAAVVLGQIQLDLPFRSLEGFLYSNKGNRLFFTSRVLLKLHRLDVLDSLGIHDLEGGHIVCSVVSGGADQLAGKVEVLKKVHHSLRQIVSCLPN